MYAADKWAPLQTVQIRKRKGPALSAHSKQLLTARNSLADHPQPCNTPAQLQQLKQLNKQIKYSIRKEKKGSMDKNPTE